MSKPHIKIHYPSVNSCIFVVLRLWKRILYSVGLWSLPNMRTHSTVAQPSGVNATQHFLCLWYRMASIGDTSILQLIPRCGQWAVSCVYVMFVRASRDVISQGIYET